MLCRECSSSKKTILFQVSAPSLLLAYLACLGAGILGGWLLLSIRGFAFFSLWGALIYGTIISEVALRVTGRKRGTQMEILVGVCSALGILAGWFLQSLRYRMPDAGVGMALPSDPWFYLMVAVAVFSAVSRIRYI